MKTTQPLLLLILIILFKGLTSALLAQNECVFSMQRAERLYQQGLVQDIPSLLLPCLKSGFTREERLGAYKLLILAYLYDDHPVEAEKSMLEFLKKFPEYEITPADPAEFSFLFGTYKTIPLFSTGLLLGGGLSFPYMFEQYAPYSLPGSEYDYQSSQMGLRLGISLTRYITSRLDLNLEAMYIQLKYKYSATPEFFSSFSRTRFTESMNLVSFPLSVTYDFGIHRLQPYLRTGIGTSVYLGSVIDPGRDYTDGSFDQVSGENLVLTGTGRRKILQFSVIAGAGLKYKIPYAGSVMLDMRFEPGLNSMANDDQRYSGQAESIWRYYILDDDLILNHMSFTLAWIYPLYRSTRQPIQ